MCLKISPGRWTFLLYLGHRGATSSELYKLKRDFPTEAYIFFPNVLLFFWKERCKRNYKYKALLGSLMFRELSLSFVSNEYLDRFLAYLGKETRALNNWFYISGAPSYWKCKGTLKMDETWQITFSRQFWAKNLFCHHEGPQRAAFSLVW